MWLLLKFVVVVFGESLPSPAAIPKLPIMSARKAWQVLSTETPQFLHTKKQPSVASTVLCGTNTGVLVYLGMRSNRRSI